VSPPPPAQLAKRGEISPGPRDGAPRPRKPAGRPSHAARQREFRRRQRHGLVVLPIEVDRDRVILALLASGRLSESEGLDPERVAAAVGEVLREWTERWLDK
jgi:hypothetical protein